VSCQVPSVQNADEIQAVLSNFKCAPEDAEKITQEFTNYFDSIGIFNLILAIEIAISKSSNGQIEYQNFLDSLSNIQS
jgi:hypothetical protein